MPLQRERKYLHEKRLWRPSKTSLQSPRQSRGALKPSKDFLLACVTMVALVALAFSLPMMSLWREEYQPPETRVQPFPITVDPVNQVIVERPEVEAMLSGDGALLAAAALNARDALDEIALSIASIPLYQTLAAAANLPRLVTIDPGFRKEEVALAFGKALAWDAEAREAFLISRADEEPKLSEGNFPPGTYAVNFDATSTDGIHLAVSKRFQTQILSRYASSTEAIVPLKDALTIASMIERETGDREEMRIISGIIWNRIFAGMRLQIDATLQYAKASANTKNRKDWWPVPYPRDKYIKSPYNTYLNEGLPPAPISNPSVAAILAALNPKQTSCLYYFHGSSDEFFCSETYDEHLASLKKQYGTGR